MLKSPESGSRSDKSTLICFIRHAEKSDNLTDPNLTEAGLIRAEKWNRIFAEISFDAIYSTDYARTIQTVTPIARKNNKEIKLYNLRAININEFQKDCIGKTVLVVGHMNTIPFFVNKLIKQDIYPEIDEDTFGNLYMVTIIGEFVTHQLLKLS